jgi:glycosyltransferase involved in cell wall biosynthesis
MNICFSVTNLELGGAQVFVVRLASWIASNTPHRVFIYDHWPEKRNASILSRAGAKVSVVSYSDSELARWLAWKINAFLAFIRVERTWRYKLNRRRFQRFLHAAHIDVLNSHMSYSDFVITGTDLPAGCRFILTLHGEYEMLMHEPHPENYFKKKMMESVRKAEAIVYTAEKNVKPVIEFRGSADNAHKIPPGVDTKLPHTSGKLTRAAVGLDTGDFVVGMVARGIPEKGWELAMDAVAEVNRSRPIPIKLSLTGDGAWLKSIVGTRRDPNVHLLQFEKEFGDYYGVYKLFDLFLFPSWFSGESVPNAVIESLHWKVPVLASEHAEIPAMLETNSMYPAGECIRPRENEAATVSAFADAIRNLENHRERLRTYSANCDAAFRKFAIDGIAMKYLSVFGAPYSQLTP